MATAARNLAECGRDENLIWKRCSDILRALAPDRVQRTKQGLSYVELPRGGPAWWVYFGPQDGTSKITTDVYPGNLMSQAREFFRRVSKREFFELEETGWRIRPYLYFGYRGVEVCRASGNKLSLQEYFDYWAGEEIQQVRRDLNGFEELFRRLLAQSLLSEEGVLCLHKGFTQTRRDHINVCPGFEVSFPWRRSDANKLDREGRFVEAVRTKVNEALATWGQSL